MYSMRSTTSPSPSGRKGETSMSTIPPCQADVCYLGGGSIPRCGPCINRPVSTWNNRQPYPRPGDGFILQPTGTVDCRVAGAAAARWANYRTDPARADAAGALRFRHLLIRDPQDRYEFTMWDPLEERKIYFAR